MTDQTLLDHLQTELCQITDVGLTIVQQGTVGGGCINQALHLQTSDGKQWFVKFNQASLYDMFQAETEGLQSLAESGAFIIPRVILLGSYQGWSYLILEYLHFTGGCSDADLGKRLANMHRQFGSTYGYHRDNYIGASRQLNSTSESWSDFFINQRLEAQYRMLRDKGEASAITPLWNDLQTAVERLLADHQVKPSLLHGDLWQGNISNTERGCSIYDPAVYYGDHETDLAMLELFGRPDADFYHAYQKIFPVQDGYQQRKTLYNLYHILNHANLFGGSYSAQAAGMIQQLIKMS